MALGMDDFGDFSSAFPADSISGVDPNGNVSFETVENDQKKTDFCTNISVPSVAKTGETGSVILPQLTDSIDMFGSCPLDSRDSSEMPNFADFGQFNINMPTFQFQIRTQLMSAMGYLRSHHFLMISNLLLILALRLELGRMVKENHF